MTAAILIVFNLLGGLPLAAWADQSSGTIIASTSKPLLKAVLKGTIFETNGRKLSGVKVSVDTLGTVTKGDGAYLLEIPVSENGDSLSVKAGADELVPKTYPIRLTPGDTTIKDFYLFSKKDKFRLYVTFIPGTTKVKELSQDKGVGFIVSILKENPDIKMEIYGMTNERKTKKGRFHLSKAYAEAVKKHLINQYNLEPTQITTQGDSFEIYRNNHVYKLKSRLKYLILMRMHPNIQPLKGFQ